MAELITLHRLSPVNIIKIKILSSLWKIWWWKVQATLPPSKRGENGACWAWWISIEIAISLSALKQNNFFFWFKNRKGNWAFHFVSKHLQNENWKWIKSNNGHFGGRVGIYRFLQSLPIPRNIRAESDLIHNKTANRLRPDSGPILYQSSPCYKYVIVP